MKKTKSQKIRDEVLVILEVAEILLESGYTNRQIHRAIIKPISDAVENNKRYGAEKKA
jgi:hypothetical protein